MPRRRNGSTKQKSIRAKRGQAQSGASKHGGRGKRSLLSRLKFW